MLKRDAEDCVPYHVSDKGGVGYIGGLELKKTVTASDYNYSQAGAYFITICVKDRHEILGSINKGDSAGNKDQSVGDAVLCVPQVKSTIVLSKIGTVVAEYLGNMNMVFRLAKLDDFVIMPNHIHLLVTIENGIRNSERISNGTQRTASPTSESPTKAIIPQIVHGLKSYTSKHVGEP